MKTKAEAAAQKRLGLKICLNCIHAGPGFKRKEPVLKCSLTGRVVPPTMTWCQYGREPTEPC